MIKYIILIAALIWLLFFLPEMVSAANTVENLVSIGVMLFLLILPFILKTNGDKKDV